MTTNIFIRRWFENDWQDFKAIRLEALSAHSDVFGASFERENSQDEEFWKGRLPNNHKGAVFGFYSDATVIGLTGVYRHRTSPIDTAILCMSYIRPEYRGRGLSDMLYKARIDWAKEQGNIRKVLVEHREGNEPSKAANQRWNFELISTDDNHVYGNGDIAKNYMYELKI